MAVFFNGFASYVREVRSPVYGEHNCGESMTVPGDDINVAAAVRRITRGELIPMRELTYGVDAGDTDLIDIQQSLQDAAPAPSETSTPSETPTPSQRSADGPAPQKKDDKS